MEDSFFVFEARNLCFALRKSGTRKKKSIKGFPESCVHYVQREQNSMAFDNSCLQRVLTLLRSTRFTLFKTNRCQIRAPQVFRKCVYEALNIKK